MIITKQQFLELLKKYKQDSEENEDKLERKMHREFVKSFNEESKKQGSLWFAEIQGQPKYSLLHITLIKNRWIFVTDRISFHISCCRKPYFSFVDDDYIVTNSNYELEKLNRLRKYLKYIMPILESIPQKIFIMPKGEHSKFTQRITEIRNDIQTLKRRSIRNAQFT